MIITYRHDDTYSIIAQIELSEMDITYVQNTYKPNSIRVGKNTTFITIDIASRYVRPLVSYLTYEEYKSSGKSKSSLGAMYADNCNNKKEKGKNY